MVKHLSLLTLAMIGVAGVANAQSMMSLWPPSNSGPHKVSIVDDYGVPP